MTSTFNNGFPGFEAKKEAAEKNLAFSNSVQTLQRILLFPPRIISFSLTQTGGGEQWGQSSKTRFTAS